MRSEAYAALAGAGVQRADVIVRYGIDARYHGQGHEITVWLGEGDRWPARDDEVLRRYEEEYRRVYGMAIPDVPVEVVTWRISAFAPASQVVTSAASGGTVRVKRERRVVFDRHEDAHTVPVYERRDLPAGAVINGPCIVEQRDTTTVLRPGWSAEVAADGSLIATYESAAQSEPGAELAQASGARR
jgi:N-methylhydantoinase A